jgi:alanine dehydrogenase
MIENREIMLGANIVNGHITYKAVSDAFGLDFMPIDSFLDPATSVARSVSA